MATSVTAVCNRALSKLGSARIVDITQDTKQARALSASFDLVRDLVLRSHRWTFALKRTTLAASATAPAFGFSLQYVLPSDFLQIDQVNDQFPLVNRDAYVSSELVDYAIEGNLLLTNFPAPLSLRYIASITDPTLWDVSFAEVLACKLAVELCEELTQSNEKRQMAQQEYRMALSMALRSNAAQRIPMLPPDGEWMNSRL